MLNIMQLFIIKKLIIATATQTATQSFRSGFEKNINTWLWDTLFLAKHYNLKCENVSKLISMFPLRKRIIIGSYDIQSPQEIKFVDFVKN